MLCYISFKILFYGAIKLNPKNYNENSIYTFATVLFPVAIPPVIATKNIILYVLFECIEIKQFTTTSVFFQLSITKYFLGFDVINLN